MKIKIRKLTPDLAEEYARFFDVTPHDVNIDEQKCYCVTWRNDDSYAHGESHWFPTREERRSRAIQFVRAGSLHGYLYELYYFKFPFTDRLMFKPFYTLLRYFLILIH